jgi:hypothetical protein
MVTMVFERVGPGESDVALALGRAHTECHLRQAARSQRKPTSIGGLRGCGSVMARSWVAVLVVFEIASSFQERRR